MSGIIHICRPAREDCERPMLCYGEICVAPWVCLGPGLESEEPMLSELGARAIMEMATSPVFAARLLDAFFGDMEPGCEG